MKCGQMDSADAGISAACWSCWLVLLLGVTPLILRLLASHAHAHGLSTMGLIVLGLRASGKILHSFHRCSLQAGCQAASATASASTAAAAAGRAVAAAVLTGPVSLMVGSIICCSTVPESAPVAERLS